MSLALHRFFGGLALDHHKELAFGRPLATLPLPKSLHVPIKGHRHQPMDDWTQRLHVAVGDDVAAGQVLLCHTDDHQPAIHAPYAGRITDIGPLPLAGGTSTTVISIEVNPDQAPLTLPSDDDSAQTLATWEPDALLDHLAQFGVVGMGGAQFPTAEKLRQAQGQIDTLILNGVECEPYIACDEALMRLRPSTIVLGALLLADALGANRIVLAVEDPLKDQYGSVLAGFHEALARLPDRQAPAFSLVQVEAIYPQGSERQLIKTLTGDEVPHDGLPRDLGVVCCNVATVAAAFDAVHHQRPLTHRIVTVTGPGVHTRINVYAPIGTPMSELIDFAGGYQSGVTQLIQGGPLSGLTVLDDHQPIGKGTLCLLALTDDHTAAKPPMPCIQCGACVDVCPAQLMPQTLFELTSHDQHLKAKAHGLMDCIECGCCSYVCPSHLPLVDWYRYGKDELRKIDADGRRGALAKRRHEARLQRIEKEIRAKDAKRQAREERLKQAQSAQAEIEAAIARAQQKKAQQP